MRGLSYLRYYWLHIAVPVLLWLVIWQTGVLDLLESDEARIEREIAEIVQGDVGYLSPGGIYYGPDPSPKFVTRIEHVMAHTQPDQSKPKHSVFIEKSEKALLNLLDEAWSIRGPPEKQGGENGRDVFTIEMERNVGEEGQTRIRMVMEADSNNIITAYPFDE